MSDGKHVLTWRDKNGNVCSRMTVSDAESAAVIVRSTAKTYPSWKAEVKPKR
jgi:hypothetical protein